MSKSVRPPALDDGGATIQCYGLGRRRLHLPFHRRRGRGLTPEEVRRHGRCGFPHPSPRRGSERGAEAIRSPLCRRHRRCPSSIALSSQPLAVAYPKQQTCHRMISRVRARPTEDSEAQRLTRRLVLRVCSVSPPASPLLQTPHPHPFPHLLPPRSRRTTGKRARFAT